MTHSTDTPEVSLVLSSYNRPNLLPSALGSIFAQSMRDFVVLVTDNAPHDATAARHKEIVDWYARLDKADGRKPRFLYHRTAGILKVDDCYWSAEWGVRKLRELGRIGRWIGFPCDDTQYFPMHLQTLLAEAAKNLWECVTVGLPVVSPLGTCKTVAGYQVWDIGDWASKTTFLVRSKHFKGFSAKPSKAGPAASDTALIRELQSRGITVGVVKQTTMCHN